MTSKNKKKSKTRSTSRKKKKNSKKLPALLFRFAFKWSFVALIWFGLFITLYTAWVAHDLPKELKKPDFKARPQIMVYDTKGQKIAKYGDLTSEKLEEKQIPEFLIHAILAIEDRNFYSHFGLDPLAIIRAASVNLIEGRVAQGGSTITQQLAKNLFLTQQRSYKRKLREALAALWLERNYTKDEILHAYINHVYMGPSIYGMPAAAKYYFGKHISDITVFEAAILAGMLKAPSRYAPDDNPDLAYERGKVVLKAMSQTGFIEAKNIPYYLKGRPNIIKKSTAFNYARTYATDYVIKQAKSHIRNPGQNLKIYTTLDTALQGKTRRILRDHLYNPDTRSTRAQGAVIVMSTDGDILALHGGVNYAESQFNRATQARRQPGSAFKPVVYAAALKKGWRPEDILHDGPLKYKDYSPSNYEDKYYGDVTLQSALSKSLNTATIRLMDHLGGPDEVIKMARAGGIKSKLPKNMSLALGSGEVSLIEMVKFYSIIANDGQSVEPAIIKEIKNSENKIIFPAGKSSQGKKRVLPEHVVKQLNVMLEAVIKSGTGKAASLPFPARGKTGTSQNHRDAWFIGYSGKAVVGVWLGHDNNTPLVVNNKNVTGGTLPALIWKDVMLAVNQEAPYLINSQDEKSGLFGMLINKLSNDGKVPEKAGSFKLNN